MDYQDGIPNKKEYRSLHSMIALAQKGKKSSNSNYDGLSQMVEMANNPRKIEK